MAAIYEQRAHPLRHAPVAFSAGEQAVDVGGNQFIAREGVDPGSCHGCPFKDGFGCALWRINQGTKCQAHNRQDGRSVIWVPRAEASKRRYHVVVINERTGIKTRLSTEPMAHAEACTFKSKFNPSPTARFQLEEARS